MPEIKKELPALLIIDMVKDNFDPLLNIYRRNPLYPLLKVASSAEFIAETIDGTA